MLDSTMPAELIEMQARNSAGIFLASTPKPELPKEVGERVLDECPKACRRSFLVLEEGAAGEGVSDCAGNSDVTNRIPHISTADFATITSYVAMMCKEFSPNPGWVCINMFTRGMVIG